MAEQIKKELTFADIRKMRRGTNTTEVYDYPFMKGTKIGMRVLTQDEIFQATLYGKKTAEELDFKDDPNVTVTFVTRELLRKACYAGESDKKFFANIDEVGEITADEVDALFDLYNRTQEKYAPVTSLETEKDFTDMIEDIKKKGIAGKSLSSYTLEKLVFILIEKSKTSQNDNGTMSGQSKKSKENTKTKPGTKAPVVIKKK